MNSTKQQRLYTYKYIHTTHFGEQALYLI